MRSAEFHCQGCGACCRVPGVVRLSDADVTALARALKLSEVDFIAQYTQLSPSRTGLVLRDGVGDACLFLSEQGRCLVYEARPQQCRDYPERWRSEAIEAVCQGFALLKKEGRE